MGFLDSIISSVTSPFKKIAKGIKRGATKVGKGVKKQFGSGFKKGFIVEVSGMIALVVGITGAFKFSEILENYLVIYIY